MHAAPLPLREVPAAASLRAAFDLVDHMAGTESAAYCRCYRLGECTVIVTREFGRWHLSIAHPARYPTWHEITQARYRLLPADATIAMLLPPQYEYINIGKHVFQMIEIPREALEGEPRK
jgi:hypothetical protein